MQTASIHKTAIKLDHAIALETTCAAKQVSESGDGIIVPTPGVGRADIETSFTP
jgi:hypothetical protein